MKSLAGASCYVKQSLAGASRYLIAILLVAYCSSLNAQTVRPNPYEGTQPTRSNSQGSQPLSNTNPSNVRASNRTESRAANEPEPWIPNHKIKPLPSSQQDNQNPNIQGSRSEVVQAVDRTSTKNEPNGFADGSSKTGSRIVRQPPTAKHVNNAVVQENQSNNGEVQQASYEAPNDPSRGTSNIVTKPNSSIALRPPSEKVSSSADRSGSSWGSMISMMASLGIVIALFLGGAWMVKKTQVGSTSSLPKEVVQILGKCPLAPRQHVYVLRFGNRLLLVSHQMGQTVTLGEIDDPLEVDRIAGLCEQGSSESVTQSFRQVFHQVTTGQLPRSSKV